MANIFVFGSNTEGRHGKGAALQALQSHGAIYGKSWGWHGNSYAIITKDLSKGVRSIPLPLIEVQVMSLLIQATNLYPHYTFNVTPIGCGLAGYTPEEIAPMFKDAPPNIILPQVFIDVLNKQS